MASNTNSPTPRQLAYLRQLANKTGTTFVYPRTAAQAGREITRLKAITRTGVTFAELQAENEARQLHGDPPLTYGTAIRDDEIDGYGSTATWSRR
jgi:hypothetical protein